MYFFACGIQPCVIHTCASLCECVQSLIDTGKRTHSGRDTHTYVLIQLEYRERKEKAEGNVSLFIDLNSAD